jgi:hypothetical protein
MIVACVQHCQRIVEVVLEREAMCAVHSINRLRAALVSDDAKMDCKLSFNQCESIKIASRAVNQKQRLSMTSHPRGAFLIEG